MMNSFQILFKEITGYHPFPWQEELFNKLVKNEIPTFVDIPTGCGKTKIMLIWLLALAQQAKNGSIQLPRRLIWIVNRRTVVDQATEEAEEIVKAIEENSSLKNLRERLAAVPVLGRKKPVAVSTLRGEYVDNEEWKEDPSRPAIVVGTVDMIGSKLLFRGYGDGRWKRPYHAGLFGVDALVVLDEVHLVPAFEKTLQKIKQIHERFPQIKPFHIMFVGATLRRREDGTLTITLTNADKKNPEVLRRIRARKILHLHQVSSEKFCETVVNWAVEKYENTGSKVAIFVQSPKLAQRIDKALKGKIKDESRVLLLTGEIRGHEREKLTDDLFKSFKFGAESGATNAKTQYLVATSAGEVGVDLDAEHCICDLAPVDSLIQRFGRVNRGGKVAESRIDLFFTEKDRAESDQKKKSHILESKERTLEFLQGLGEEIDVSPEAIAEWKIPPEAFSPEPFSPELTESEIELWSMTSVYDTVLDPNGWYKIEYWLHGREEAEPDVFLVWRWDIKHLASLPLKNVEEILIDFFYPFSRERLRVPITEFVEFCQDLKKKIQRENFAELKSLPVLVVGDKAVCLTVEKIANMEEGDLRGYAFSTIFLPCEVGGLNESGYLDKEKIGRPKEDLDVAGLPPKKMEKLERKRLLCVFEEGMWKIMDGREVKEVVENLDEFLSSKYTGWKKRKFLLKEAPETYLVYLKKFELQSYESEKEIYLDEHHEQTRKYAEELCEKLYLPPSLADAVKAAAGLHDEGKRLKLWQEKVLRNENPSNPLAKGSKGRGGEYLNYRHELGSLLLAKQKCSEDLVLHLISASHGRARPSFEEEDFSHADGEYVGAETPEVVTKEIREECAIRFDQLQALWGYWNLAYLEGLVKAADIMASKEG